MASTSRTPKPRPEPAREPISVAEPLLVRHYLQCPACQGTYPGESWPDTGANPLPQPAAPPRSRLLETLALFGCFVLCMVMLFFAALYFDSRAAADRAGREKGATEKQLQESQARVSALAQSDAALRARLKMAYSDLPVAVTGFEVLANDGSGERVINGTGEWTPVLDGRTLTRLVWRARFDNLLHGVSSAKVTVVLGCARNDSPCSAGDAVTLQMDENHSSYVHEVPVWPVAAGNWSVGTFTLELLVNGQSQGQVNFTIQ